MTTISMSEIRLKLSELANRVIYGGERVVVEKNNKPAFALVSMEDMELLERLESALERLPEEQRTVFLLRVQDGLSYEEIAETMGTPKGTVMSRLARARMALRKYMGMPA